MTVTINRQVRDFTDIDFSFKKHPITNNVSVKKNQNAIIQSIINLLSLREGDYPFHLEIYSPMYGYMFDNFSAVSKISLQNEIYRYISTYEPRVTIESVTVSYPSQNVISCDIVCYIVNVTEPLTINILIDRLR